MAENRRRVVVAGESLIDRILRPDGTHDDVPGGGPFTTARALARLGLPVSFVGGLSSDDEGRLLRARLEADRVDLTLAVATDAPTLIARAVIDEAGVASYRFAPPRSAATEVRPSDVPATLPDDTAALHVGTLGLVLEPVGTTVTGLVEAAPGRVLVVADPNVRPSAIDDEVGYRSRLARILERADVVKVSADDLAWLDPGRPAADAARAVLEAGPALVLLTDGSRPVRAVTGHETREVPVPPAPVVDTVGAGDAFGAGFLTAWLRSGRARDALDDLDAVEDAVRFATRVAAWTVGRAGADLPRTEDLA